MFTTMRCVIAPGAAWIALAAAGMTAPSAYAQAGKDSGDQTN